MSEYIHVQEACKIADVSGQCIRRWVKEGRIRSIKSETGRYRYNKEDVHKCANIPLPNIKKKEKDKREEKIIYCRVSSRKQLDDLERQKEYLGNKFPEHRLVTDIGSGIN